jgi:hypothetical protein
MTAPADRKFVRKFQAEPGVNLVLERSGNQFFITLNVPGTSTGPLHIVGTTKTEAIENSRKLTARVQQEFLQASLNATRKALLSGEKVPVVILRPDGSASEHSIQRVNPELN